MSPASPLLAAGIFSTRPVTRSATMGVRQRRRAGTPGPVAGIGSEIATQPHLPGAVTVDLDFRKPQLGYGCQHGRQAAPAARVDGVFATRHLSPVLPRGCCAVACPASRSYRHCAGHAFRSRWRYPLAALVEAHPERGPVQWLEGIASRAACLRNCCAGRPVLEGSRRNPGSTGIWRDAPGPDRCHDQVEHGGLIIIAPLPPHCTRTRSLPGRASLTNTEFLPSRVAMPAPPGSYALSTLHPCPTGEAQWGMAPCLVEGLA